MYSDSKNGVSTPARTVDEAMAKHTLGGQSTKGCQRQEGQSTKQLPTRGMDWVDVELHNNGDVPSCEKRLRSRTPTCMQRW